MLYASKHLIAFWNSYYYRKYFDVFWNSNYVLNVLVFSSTSGFQVEWIRFADEHITAPHGKQRAQPVAMEGFWMS